MTSRVAIIEDSSVARMLLSSLLTAGHYDVSVGASSETDALLELPPDAVLLGPGVEDAVALIPAIRTKTGASAPPILVLSRDTAPAQRLAALQAGATEVLRYPIDAGHFLARLRSVIRSAEPFRELRRRRVASMQFGFAESAATFERQKRLVLVSENAEPSMIDWPDLPGVRQERCGRREVLSADAQTRQVEAFVLDWSGTFSTAPVRQLLPELRARVHTRHAGIVVLHDPDDDLAAVQALDNGATDAVPLDVAREEIALRLERVLALKGVKDTLRRSTEASVELAVRDSLTGLYNRRYAEAYLADLVSDRAADQAFALMIADIDHFKAINDTYGHAVGDMVLRKVADQLCQQTRAVDLVARLGGEEFLIVLAESNLAQARHAADRLRNRVGRSPIKLDDGSEVAVTVSLGLSMGDARMIERLRGERRLTAPAIGLGDGILSDLISRADRALYRAKALGRNQVQVAV
ncbi:diguanylate cyclase [Alphaproteobacteria bacterium GH1-50]|uniref:diguanylate cyclase n=1 Tax=Kangsaoukella pontilimi TaxID=2691042 RepID=A0A7C9MUP9_9RHOB|nr:diguanylate cyclase [Kangsaoukella pontilimi]MXQ06314.1 diguanylate cyclase [Kangsaoukella pontilimi]